jgi:hypothetical protein
MQRIRDDNNGCLHSDAWLTLLIPTLVSWYEKTARFTKESQSAIASIGCANMGEVRGASL